MEIIKEENYSIRQFLPTEVAQYKALRLEALQLEPGFFGNSYAMEAAFTPEQWLARVSNPNSACFGLCCAAELMGITGIIINSEQPEEAYLTQSYIRKAHCGKGLSRLFYQARITWAQRHQVKSLLIGHRASNLISKAANQKFGFIYSHSESRTWPDGETEDMVYYRRDV